MWISGLFFGRFKIKASYQKYTEIFIQIIIQNLLSFLKNSQICGGYWVNSVNGIVSKYKKVSTTKTNMLLIYLNQVNVMSSCNYFVKLDKSLIQIQPTPPVSTVKSTVFSTNGVYVCLGVCSKTVNWSRFQLLTANALYSAQKMDRCHKCLFFEILQTKLSN
jgi:hypothetical protein